MATSQTRSLWPVRDARGSVLVLGVGVGAGVGDVVMVVVFVYR